MMIVQRDNKIKDLQKSNESRKLNSDLELNDNKSMYSSRLTSKQKASISDVESEQVNKLRSDLNYAN